MAGGSMAPTLQPGDRLLLIRFGAVRQGDLVAVADPRRRGRTVVKRVARVSGAAGVVVLGDNPDGSTDSRHFGPVLRSAVRGRVLYRYAPEHRRGWLARPRGGTAPRRRYPCLDVRP